METAECHRRIDAVWRLESPRLTGTLIRVVRDPELAEELAQDALIDDALIDDALERWPASDMPAKPGARLTTTAKHRAIAPLRHRQRAERKHALPGGDPGHEAHVMPDLDALDHDPGEDLLRLIFTACHPVLPCEAQIALTLRRLGGLATAEIARVPYNRKPPWRSARLPTASRPARCRAATSVTRGSTPCSA